jgi:siroheme synthase-like protein
MTTDYAKPYYPVFLDLAGRLCVIVGGGAVALRKARTLADYGADVVVIAPDVSEELIGMQADGLVTVEQRGYVRGDLAEAFLAVCATDSEEVNRAVHAEAEERRCLVNVVDVPELCVGAGSRSRYPLAALPLRSRSASASASPPSSARSGPTT